MSELLRRIHIITWPIWVKLLIGFLLAVIIPVGLVLLLTLSTVQQIGSQNVQGIVTETGARQARAIGIAFDRALASISDFIADEINLNQIRASLPSSSGAVVDPNNQFNLATNFQNRLLIVTNPIFEEIRLVQPNGQLVIQAKPDGVVIGGSDLSDSVVFQQGSEANLLGQNQTLSIELGADNQLIVNAVNILRVTVPGVRDRVVIGYLLATINVQPILDTNLPITSEQLEVSTRLVTRGGLEVDMEGARLVPALDVNNTLLDEAIAGRPQIETFRRDGVEHVRYYSAVANSPFVLISESAADSVASQITNFIVERGFALVLGLVFLVSVLVVLANQLLTPPLRRISQAIQGVARGNYNMPLPDVQRGDEIGELAGSVADMRKRVLDIINDLEQRIEVRARDMTATREISRAAATERDLQRLMNQVVNLIVERFPNIYHAQIFLLDNENRYAVLRASTGEAGRTLLARGHRLAVGSISVVGRATEMGEIVIARDATTSRVHRANELLPDTLAELAIPLRVGDRVIGVLDVQSRQSDTFDTEQQDVLQTMADQIAVAIENARLYAESVRQLDELERNRRVSTIEAWHQYMDNLRAPRLESTAGILPGTSQSDALRQMALARGEVVVGDQTERRTIPMIVPIRLRGQLLGVVEWEVPDDEFDQNKLQLAQDLTDRLAVNLENARLFQESQRAIRREQLVNEISAELTAQNDIDQILQTAVREVGRALRAPQVSIRLSNQKNGHSNGHQNGYTSEE